jgi:anti-sigma regulatory factor (Ser/Thr protein kinase)
MFVAFLFMQFKLKPKNSSLIDNVFKWLDFEMINQPQYDVKNIKIALGEVLQNIIRHGYKNNLNEENFIDIECQQDQDRLTFILRDFAEPCKPDSFLNKEFIPNENGHMGLSIIRKLTDEFSIKPLQDGNETKLVFRIE